MTSLIAACLLSIIPQDSGVIRDHFEVMEVSHFYDEKGDLVFDQLLFWDPEEIQAWKLIKAPSHMPYRDWVNGGYKAIFADGDNIRVITSRSRNETWEQYDRELERREFLPKEKRRDLGQPKKIK